MEQHNSKEEEQPEISKSNGLEIEPSKTITIEPSKVICVPSSNTLASPNPEAASANHNIQNLDGCQNDSDQNMAVIQENDKIQKSGKKRSRTKSNKEQKEESQATIPPEVSTFCMTNLL